MELKSAITKVVQETLSEDGWYTWDALKNLPEGIAAEGSSVYEQNRSLKRNLSTAYKAGSADRKTELTKFFIYNWGGVHGNSDDSLKAYALDTADTLIGRGTTGVASWSKALTMREPDTYAIYDARVACSLNGLQIINAVAPGIFFPVLPSQNVSIVGTNKIITEFASQKGWVRLSNSEFYRRYLSLIQDVATSISTDLMTVEMVLFSKAVVIAEQAKTIVASTR